MAEVPTPQKKVVSDLKASILTPALTSHFQCWFTVPEITGLGGFNEFISLSCAEASLPSTSLATHQMSNDFTGITERHAYRRQYNDTSSFTFYVDHEYKIIKTFETWIGSIVNEQNDESNNYFYRVKFPQTYQSSFYIKKFEKNYKRSLTYQFLKAYPISIDSMPVTYEQSTLLKCTVNFNFSRYLVETSNADGIVNSYDNADLFESDYDIQDGEFRETTIG
tara:strand:- start:19 stop:684 length:666 start_codon:yes stop_codon:yes gene_type:complete